MADRAKYQIAQYRFDSGYYITARNLFSQVAWSQDDSPLGQAARYWRGMTWLHSAGEPDSLRTGLRLIKSVANSATDPDIIGKALLSTAELSLRLGQPDSAYAYAAAVLEKPYLEDHYPRAMGMEARACYALGDLEQARLIYQTLSARFPDTWDGREARRWLAQQREAIVQARLDSMRVIGAPGAAQGGSEGGRWSVQVGAYSNLGNATDQVMKLTREGYEAWHTTKRVEGRFYVVVLVGRFETRAEANAFGRSLAETSPSVVSFRLYEIVPNR
jgi:TolA-binding protein